jgi:cobaltochelatase CobT
MDTATGLANDAHYLDQHLRDVLRRHEQTGGVEIFGVGVGLDLSGFYSRSRALDLSTAPGNEACFEIVEMLAGHGRR